MIDLCGRCYEESSELFPSNCTEKPETLAGQPIGQYHCPDCGTMIIAGLPHPPLCKRCLDRTHPGIDGPLTPGKTGKFPYGKIRDDDEGELAVGVCVDPKTGNVVIDFGCSVSWIAMQPKDAIEFAKLILKYAQV